MKKKQTPIERFLALSDAEKDAEVAEYESGADLSKFRPLTPKERKLWRSVKRKMGRPRIGKGAKMVAVSMEIGLLKRVAGYVREIPQSATRPLNTAERRQWRRIKRKMGRPVIGKGSKTVAVSMEIGLLKRADKYAKAHSMKRAELIAEALRLILDRKTG